MIAPVGTQTKSTKLAFSATNHEDPLRSFSFQMDLAWHIGIPGKKPASLMASGMGMSG